ncbi:TetR/AcrR family transcriptional regulator [Actinomadura oligospora]|uniref:TetR/AcrR family transcriptional regulator n=1 Tax=Actinomadura oligospora TaxID=111804 RepID=UPI000478EF00|nr:TetR/AcrR family transcriptional regulator C-terminal domain-containing protein [Actinomadura oligospora]
MPRPRSLTRPQVAAAALVVVDRDGLAALSMRAVAKEIGVSTMALYRYVDGRDDIEGLVVERVMSGMDTTPPPDGPWRDRVATLVERIRLTVGAHPEVIPLTPVYRHRSPTLLRWSETMLGVLADAGFDGEARVIALRGVTAYIIGAIQLEHLGPLSGPGTDAIAALPEDEYPHMSAAGHRAREISSHEEFRRGLDLLLNGLDSRAVGGEDL